MDFTEIAQKKHPDFYPDFGHIFGKVKRTHPDFHQNPVGALIITRAMELVGMITSIKGTELVVTTSIKAMELVMATIIKDMVLVVTTNIDKILLDSSLHQKHGISAKKHLRVKR